MVLLQILMGEGGIAKGPLTHHRMKEHRAALSHKGRGRFRQRRRPRIDHSTESNQYSFGGLIGGIFTPLSRNWLV